MLIGAAVLSVSLLGISSFFQSALHASDVTQSVFQGDYLLEEGVEAVKLLRDGGYTSNITTLSTTTPTYLSWGGAKWATSSVNTLIDGRFERAIIAAEVRRDSSDDISASGAMDPNTKLITVSVAWAAKGATTTKTIQTYVMNIFNN